MANMQVKLSLDASGFTGGMKDASKATKEYTNQISSMTKNLPNAKRELAQMKREASNLALVISQMSEEEKKTAEGRALIQHFDEVRRRGAEMIDTMGDINAEMRALASDTANLDAAKQAFSVFGNTLSSVAGVIGLVTGEEEKMKKAVVAFTTVQSILNTVTAVSNALNKSSILMLKTKAIQQKAAAVAAKLETSAQQGNIVATKAATIAQKAFNAVAKANPIGLLITALTTVIGLFLTFASSADDATDSLGKLEKGENDLATAEGRLKDAQEETGKVAGELSGKYEVLRAGYLACKTDMERTQFIKNNKTGFEELGIEVNNLTDAYDFLVKKAPQVRRALMQIAVAKGMQKSIENYASTWSEAQAKNPIQQPDLSYDARFKVSRLMNGGYNFHDNWMYEAGITNANIRDFDASTNTAKLDLQGIGKARNLWETKNGQERTRRQKEFNDIMQGLVANWTEADERAARFAEEAGLLYENGDIRKPGGGTTPKQKTTSTSKKTSTTTPKKTAADKKNENKEITSAREAELKSQQQKEKQLLDQMYLLEKANKKDTDEYRNKEKELVKVRQRIKDINDIGNIKDPKEAETSKTKLENHIKDLQQQKEALQDAQGNITNQEEWNRLDAEIKDSTQLLEYMQAQLDGIELTKLDELEKTFKSASDAYKKALENDPNEQLESTKKLGEAYKKAQKEYNDLKDNVEKKMEIVVDVKETYLKDKIKEFTDKIQEIDLEIEFNLELSPLDKGKLQNQRDAYQRELNKWQGQLNAYNGLITPGDNSTNSNNSYQLKDTNIGAPKLTNVEVEISKINWSKAAEGIEQGFDETSVMGDNMKMLYDTKNATLANATSAINNIKSAYKNGIFGDDKQAREQAQKYIDEINKYLENVQLEPIEVSLKTENFKSQISSAASTLGELGNAVGQAFDAMNELFKVNEGEDNKSLQVGKIIAQTLATLALSFAQAMAQEKTGVWGWIAGGIAGMAQLIAMTAQIKAISKADGYATGGVVGGHSYYGDRILVRANSGELILNKKQQETVWSAMQPSNNNINTHLYGNVTVSGDQLNIALSNRAKKISKRR